MPLAANERLHYRDQLRAARYAALADAEGFGEICFAIEALGLRLYGKEGALGSYADKIRSLWHASRSTAELASRFPAFFTRFDAMYEAVRRARNDAMHSGAYARHATGSAIELCIGLEDALMEDGEHSQQRVADYMVKTPVFVEPWQPLAHARKLMLEHSFSCLPVFTNKWMLLSETAVAKFLHKNPRRRELLATSIGDAAREGLGLLPATETAPAADAASLLTSCTSEAPGPSLWLVIDHGRLVGVLSPFELM